MPWTARAVVQHVCLILFLFLNVQSKLLVGNKADLIEDKQVSEETAQVPLMLFSLFFLRRESFNFRISLFSVSPTSCQFPSSRRQRRQQQMLTLLSLPWLKNSSKCDQKSSIAPYHIHTQIAMSVNVMTLFCVLPGALRMARRALHWAVRRKAKADAARHKQWTMHAWTEPACHVINCTWLWC